MIQMERMRPKWRGCDADREDAIQMEWARSRWSGVIQMEEVLSRWRRCDQDREDAIQMERM